MLNVVKPCSSCVFWMQDYIGPNVSEPVERQGGECRAYAPRPINSPYRWDHPQPPQFDMIGYAIFPITRGGQGCGEHLARDADEDIT